MTSALSRLAEYSSDENESEEERKSPVSKRQKLPLPSNFIPTKIPEVIDDSSLHQGRKRKFAHERGNWSSYVYIPFYHKKTFNVFCDQIIEYFNNSLQLMKVEEPHISLSKTFVLYYHWIKEFHASLKQKLSAVSRFEISFDNIKVYCNEDSSRTFIALAVGSSTKPLLTSIELIDLCLEEYKLPPYYEDASFHMSFAWCLGNKKDLIEDKLHEVVKIYEIYKESSDFSFTVDHYVFKTGFKEFKIELK